MKKQLLVGAFMLASFLTAQAQVVYTENFENIETIFPENQALGWGSLDFDGDQSPFWHFEPNAMFTQFGFSGSVMGSDNFIVDNAGNVISDTPDSDNALLSVALKLPVDKDLTASFKIAGVPYVEGATSSYEIYIIGTAETAILSAGTNEAEIGLLLNTLTPAVIGIAVPLVATLVEVDLAAYKGQPTALLVRHRNGVLRNSLLLDDYVVRVNSTAGVNENLVASLSVYPNPANDVINITNTENTLVTGIIFSDLNGRTVKENKFAGVANAQINISDLASGVYMMSISSDKGVVTRKIVKN